jgi:hypothetical protein
MTPVALLLWYFGTCAPPLVRRHLSTSFFFFNYPPFRHHPLRPNFPFHDPSNYPSSFSLGVIVRCFTLRRPALLLSPALSSLYDGLLLRTACSPPPPPHHHRQFLFLFCREATKTLTIQ